MSSFSRCALAKRTPLVLHMFCGRDHRRFVNHATWAHATFVPPRHRLQGVAPVCPGRALQGGPHGLLFAVLRRGKRATASLCANSGEFDVLVETGQVCAHLPSSSASIISAFGTWSWLLVHGLVRALLPLFPVMQDEDELGTLVHRYVADAGHALSFGDLALM